MPAQYQSGSAVFALGTQAAPTVDVTVAPGSDLALFAAFWIRGAQASNTTISSAVRDGQTPQVLGPVTLGNQRLYLLYLLNPNVGTASLTVTPSITSGLTFGLHAAVASGIHQIDPPDDYDSASGTSNNPAVTTDPTAPDGFIFAAIHHEASNPLTSGDTALLNQDHGAHVSSSSYALPAGAGPYTMDWSAPASDTWVAGAMSFKVAANPNSPPAVALVTLDGATLEAEAVLELTPSDPDGDPCTVEIGISDDAAFSMAHGSNLADNNSTSGGGNLHPNPQAGAAWTGEFQVDDRFGQSILGMGGILDKITMLVGPGSTDPGVVEAGDIVVRVYATQGTHGVDAAPLNPAAAADTPTPGWLAQSDPLRVDGATFTYTWHDLTFSGLNRIRLEKDICYMLIIDWWADFSDYNNTVVFSGDGTLPHAGNAYVDGNSVNWGVRTDFDLRFKVYESFVSLGKVSDTDAGFENTVTPADTDPFNSGEQIRFTVQVGDALPPGTYHWHARAKDTGTGQFSDWSETRSFTVEESGGDGSIEGALSATLADATLEASGELPVTGALAASLAGATVTAAGEAIVSGELNATLEAATLDADGALSISGALAVSLDAATIEAEGELPVSGALAGLLEDAAVAATGALPVTGALDQTLEAVALDASGALSVVAALSATLERASLAATGGLPIAGAVVATLEDAAFESSGDLPVAGALSAALADATLSASGWVGEVPVVGSLTVTLEHATLSGDGVVAVAGSMTATLETATLDAAGVLPITGALVATLEGAALDSEGAVAVAGVLDATLEGAELAATGAVGEPPIYGVLIVTLADATLVGSGAVMVSGLLAQTLQAATVVAAGESIISGELDVTTGDVVLVSSGALPVAGGLNATLAAAILVSSGTVMAAVPGMIDLTAVARDISLMARRRDISLTAPARDIALIVEER